jgi:thiol-disulfide isomerase/thioredoxin
MQRDVRGLRWPLRVALIVAGLLVTAAASVRMAEKDPTKLRDAESEFRAALAADPGSKIADLRGKVVLIDFWETECPRCVRAVPFLRKLQSDHAKDAFVILAISVDADEPAWRTFTTKNGMVWPQYRDGDRQMQTAFGVRDLPAYVLIDGEGIERVRVTGVGFQDAKALGRAIEDQLKR